MTESMIIWYQRFLLVLYVWKDTWGYPVLTFALKIFSIQSTKESIKHASYIQQAQVTWADGLLGVDKGDLWVSDAKPGTWHAALCVFLVFYHQHGSLVCQINQRDYNSGVCNGEKMFWYRRALELLFGGIFIFLFIYREIQHEN